MQPVTHVVLIHHDTRLSLIREGVHATASLMLTHADPATTKASMAIHESCGDMRDDVWDRHVRLEAVNETKEVFGLP